MLSLPTGTVTYLMTDVVGSSRLWEADEALMSLALRRHDEIAEAVSERHNGLIIKARGEGDSLFIVFGRATDAVACAVDLQLAVESEPWPGRHQIRIRSALHSGDSELRDSDYYGTAVNRCARLRSIANPTQILLSSAAKNLAVHGLPLDCSLRDLGIHRLKDLLRAEQIFEIVHPRLSSGSATPASLNSVSHNLPIQLTSFVGREIEVLTLRKALESTRLLSLLGSGGTGKTRLGLQIGAESTDDFSDGVWFIDLTRISNPDGSADFVASVLANGSTGDPTDRLLIALAGKRCLVILDNCEHVIDAIANLVLSLLQSSEELKVICTSREALRVPGESRYRVGPLAVPGRAATFEEITASDSCRLFAERARAHSHRFELTRENAQDVVNLCRALDGIPLAIEHAASHAELLAPRQMVQRFRKQLRDLKSKDRGLNPRHQTLRAAMDWSYDSLNSAEQFVLQACSVFVGGWTVEAAEAVCSDCENVSEVAAHLGALIDKSFVFLEEVLGSKARYGMLKFIGEYAAEMLQQPEVVRTHHSEYFCEKLASNQGPSDYEELDADFENHVGAIEWSLDQSDPGSFEHLMRLRTFLVRRGHYATGARLLQSALGRFPELPKERIAQARNVLGVLWWRLNETERAEASFQESQALCRAVGDELLECNVLQNLGLLAVSRKQLSLAKDHLVHCSEIYARLGEFSLAAQSQMNIGRLELDEGNLPEAEAILSEACERLQNLGDPSRIATCESNLGLVCLIRSDFGAAANWFGKALARLQERFDPAVAGAALIGVGTLALRANERIKCVEVLGAVKGLQDTYQFEHGLVETMLLAQLESSVNVQSGALHAPYTAGRHSDHSTAINQAAAICELVAARFDSPSRSDLDMGELQRVV